MIERLTKRKRRLEIRQEAIKALETSGRRDNDVCCQAEALVGSLDDTLSDEFVPNELKAIKRSGKAFSKDDRNNDRLVARIGYLDRTHLTNKQAALSLAALILRIKPSSWET